MVLAIYPGTFDPMTLGHEDVLARASRLFDRVILAVAASERKSPVFSLEERARLARVAAENYDNVEVETYDGLLCDFAREKGASVIVRGVRAVSDFDYEFQMAGMNKTLIPEAETIFLIPNDRYRYVTGSVVREIASMGGDVSQFVSPVVLTALKRRFEK